MEHKVSIIGRRDFIGIGAATATLYSAFRLFGRQIDIANTSMLSMPKLPYPANALEPYISERTINIHYGEHHKSYYDIVTEYVKGILKNYETSQLEEIIVKSKDGLTEERSLHHIAVLLYNHNLYWPSMKPGGGGKPKDKLAGRIDKSFGGYDLFRKEFLEKAMDIGSGWVCFVRSKEALILERTDYHNSPLLKGADMLLAFDVWEHAYYLDYLNDKQKYVEAFLDNLINWENIENRLKQLEG